MEDKILELPLNVIQASSGFSLDIGGSMAKLIYRSKMDFCNGVPKDNERTKKGLGIVRQRLIPREQIDDVLTFIKDNCDITTAASGESLIYSAGLGGNKHKTKIEEQLNVKLENMNEVSCFATAMHLMLKTKTPEQLFTPPNNEGIKQGEHRYQTYRALKENMEKSAHGNSTVPIHDDIPDCNLSGDSHFPFILAMCGSGFGFIRVNEDGSYVILDLTTIAGRFFLGLTSFLTGVTEFSEITSLLEESNGKTADMFGSDLVDRTQEKSDFYSLLDDDYRVFAFGKGLTDAKDKATKGDLIHSLLESICENTASYAYQIASTEKVPRVYFCGNFVNIAKAQQMITKGMQMKKYREGEQVHFEFIKNGGFLGSLGAFIEAHAIQQKK